MPTLERHTCTAQNAPQFKTWFAERGGIALWRSINLSNPGQTWTTPLRNPLGEPATKPSWQADSTPYRVITDPAEVDVIVPKEVKRFRIHTRMGGQGLTVKLTDASTAKVRKAVETAGDDAWYEFDYATEDAVIFVPGAVVPLPEWQEPTA